MFVYFFQQQNMRECEEKQCEIERLERSVSALKKQDGMSIIDATKALREEEAR